MNAFNDIVNFEYVKKWLRKGMFKGHSTIKPVPSESVTYAS